MAELTFQRADETLTITLAEHRAKVPWAEIAPTEHLAQQVYDDAAAYGRTLFEQVIRDAAMCSALLDLPANERLVLHIEDPEVALIPWEYLRDPTGTLLAARLNMVRYVEGRAGLGLDMTQPLSIVAVPVSPVDEARPLNTEQEWRRLTEAVSAPHKALSLLRVRPPTLASLEQTLPGEGLSIVHFMGHSGFVHGKSVLEFEDLQGRSQPIDAATFADALDEHVFLVILNSCLSAVAIPTEFGNIARAVVSQGVPYALGMQAALLDDAALEMSQTLYQHLLQGRNVEEAVRRTRRALESNTLLHRPQWVAGIPVLYTHLREPAPALRLQVGQPTISPDLAHLQASCDLTALPQAQHFVGRSQEISDALAVLLAPAARGFVLLHGLGGIGKTALAYAIADRASWSYRDRVLAVSFETFATQENDKPLIVSETFADRFYTRLAVFCGLDPSKYSDTLDLQKAILQQRVHSRSLLVLDNMETLIDAQKQGDPSARTLATFLSRLPEGEGAILLTSRSHPPTDWGACHAIPIAGLSEEASADLFLALLPADRRPAAGSEARLALAKRVQGHPLSIRLLAGRFAEVTDPLETFLQQIEEQLKHVEQTTPSSLEDPERQRTLYACLDYSITRLTPEQTQVLHACSLFLAPFLREFVSIMLEDETEQTAVLLQQLMRLGLLERKTRTFPEGSLELLEMHPMLRWYIHNRFPAMPPTWEQQYGLVYEQLARQAWQPEGGYDQSAWIRFLIRQSLPDCEAALGYLAPARRSALAYHLARTYERMWQNRRALTLYELALELNQATGNLRGIAAAQSAMANVLRLQGKLQEAFALYQQSIHITTKLGDLKEVAVTQNAMANVLRQQGNPQEALTFHQQALQTKIRVGDLRGIAVTQTSIADILSQQGKPQEALALYKKSLRIVTKIGDLREVALTQYSIAGVLSQQGKPQEALALYQQALPIAMEIGDVQGVAVTQTAIADILHEQGKLQEALPLYQQALQTMIEIGDLRSVSVTQTAIAGVLSLQGKLQEALALYQQALQTTMEVGDLREIAVTQHAMANVLHLQGKPQEALNLYQQSLQIALKLGDPRKVATTQHTMADVLSQQGKSQEALNLYQQALQTMTEIGDLSGISRAKIALAEVLSQQGKLKEALALCEQALQTMIEINDIRSVAVIQHTMANVLHLQGKLQEALVLYQRSLQTKIKLGDPREVAATQANLAYLLFKQGKYDQGLLLAWEAYTLFRKHGYGHDAHSMQENIIHLKSENHSLFTLSWNQQIKEEQPDWLHHMR